MARKNTNAFASLIASVEARPAPKYSMYKVTYKTEKGGKFFEVFGSYAKALEFGASVHEVLSLTYGKRLCAEGAEEFANLVAGGPARKAP